jgi:hypothetical protein
MVLHPADDRKAQTIIKQRKLGNLRAMTVCMAAGLRENLGGGLALREKRSKITKVGELPQDQ